MRVVASVSKVKKRYPLPSTTMSPSRENSPNAIITDRLQKEKKKIRHKSNRRLF